MADLQLWKKTNQLQLLISTLYRSSFGGKVQKASFLADIHYQKLHLFVVDFLLLTFQNHSLSKPVNHKVKLYTVLKDNNYF